MLAIIVSTLFISLVLNVFLKKFQLPTIIGYIFTGTIIAYGFGLHDAVNNHELKEIAEFGVVFLMFTIGLEFSIEHLKKMKYEVFVAGSLQILISVLTVFLIAYYVVGIEQKTSFIIGLAIALSSTAIVLKTFNETGQINKRYGQRTLGILIMQDIAVIPILLIIGFMSNQSDQNISSILIEMLLSAFALLIIMYLIGKYFLEPFFNAIVKTDSDELFIGTILFLAIGSSFLGYILGFSYSLGAFIAGMLIAETKYKHQVEADLVPFRDILLGIFFITVGMQIKFNIIFEYVDIIALLLLCVIILKFIIIFTIVRFNENNKTSLKTALSLVQIGEFSLALLELARSYDLIGSPYGQVMIVAIVLSMIITPFILKNLSNINDYIFKKNNFLDENNSLSNDYENHSIIIGFGEFGQNIAKHLKTKELPYLAIENNIERYQVAKQEHPTLVFANGVKKDILKSLGIKKANSVIVTVDNPKKLYSVCETLTYIVELNKIYVKVHSKFERIKLEQLGIKNIIVENEISSQSLINQLLRD